MTRLEKIAKLVYESRFAEGWTQSELARQSHVGASTIAKIEQATGEVEPLTLQKLAIAFGMSYDEDAVAFRPSSERMVDRVVMLIRAGQLGDQDRRRLFDSLNVTNPQAMGIAAHKMLNRKTP